MSQASQPTPDNLITRIRRPLGAIRRGMRRTVTRWRHPARQRRALAELRARPVPQRILALCLGNICRSPYVEAYLKPFSEELGFEVFSRGFIGPGRPPPPEARDAAEKRKVDTRDHVSALVTEADLVASDLVILVDPSHGPRLRKTLGDHDTPVLVLGDLDPVNTGARTIRDPWGNDPIVFDASFQRLDRCLEVLVKEWRGRKDAGERENRDA